MEDLRSLLRIMRPGEKRMLRHLLSRVTNSEENQRYKLFKLLDGDLTLSEEQVKEQHFNVASHSAFSHLKHRLREDILSVLLIKEAPKRIAQANRAAQFECWKKLAQAYVLIFRGAKAEGAKILRSAKELAIKYELAAELVSIGHVTREALYSFTDGKQLNEVNRSLRNDLQFWSDILRSEELSFYISLPQMKEELLKTEGEGSEGRMIDELKGLYIKSGAARVGFWYYMADVESCIGKKDFSQAISLGLEFLKLVEEHPSVRSKNNIAGVNQMLGFAYLNLRQYPKAQEHLKRSEKLFPASGFNRLQCLQVLVQAEAARADYAGAFNHIETALAHSQIMNREHLQPRWLFIRACVEFLSGNVEASFKTINKDGYLMRQQDEWNVQFRLLEMMLLIEMKDEEWLEFKLDATRKFLTRHKELNSPRVQAAVDLAGNLLRKELDFGQISDKNKVQLRSCLQEEPGYEWNPSGVEMVRFDRWTEAKMPAQEGE